MELTTRELEELLCVSQVTIATYAKEGRLTRLRRGFYDAASLAHLWGTFDGESIPYTRDREELNEIRKLCREMWRVQQSHKFKRDMQRVIRFRSTPPETNLSKEQRTEIAAAVKQFAELLG